MSEAVQRSAASPPRMSLKAVVKGRQQQPHRIVLYGVEGIGKSTFASEAPKPIFLGAEDGTAHLEVERFPTPDGGLSWHDALDAVRTLTNEAHEYKTLAVDTLDWIEPLIWSHICKRDGEKSIESYGYGKGYVAALDEWRQFLAALERMQARRSMNVILLAHSWIKTFKNPEGEDYDRWQMKLNDKASGLVREWARTVLFAKWEKFAVKDEKTKRPKGVSTGARILHTVETAAYDAKNRDNLPETLPLSWEEFAQAVTSGKPAEPAALREECERKSLQLEEPLRVKASDALARAKDDPVKLAKLNDWLNAKLGGVQ